ncbi:phosphodiesterase [bacterium]|nr:phosphodiesterase [bacterium]
MKISVISDTHGSVAGWEEANFITSSSDLIIHCGDILNRGKNPSPEQYYPEELADIINNLEKQVLLITGNCDSEIDTKMINIPLSYPFLFCVIENIRILATHGHLFSEEEILLLAKKWKIDIMITGHTHQWKLEKHSDCVWINPGSPSIPRGEPSVALVDTPKRIIQIFNTQTKNIIATLSF